MKYKLLAIILMAATINSCGGASSQNAKAQSADNETKVLIKTTVGDITIKLYNETPSTGTISLNWLRSITMTASCSIV